MDFDIAPHFLRLNQLSSLFTALSNDSNIEETPKIISTEQIMLQRCFSDFIALLVHCALTGLSKFPHGGKMSTAMEKLKLLLQRMLLSQGMTTVFGPNPPRFLLEKVQTPKKERTIQQKISPQIFPETELSKVPDDLTPLKAVQALDFFNETLRASFTSTRTQRTDEKPQSKRKSKIRSSSDSQIQDPGIKPLYKIPDHIDFGLHLRSDSREIWTGDPKHYPHQPRTPMSPNNISQPIRALRYPKNEDEIRMIATKKQAKGISRDLGISIFNTSDDFGNTIQNSTPKSLTLEEKIAKALNI